MKEGYLCYNSDNDRYGIIDSSNKWVILGLHCGDCFAVATDEGWVDTRIENCGEWYLVGTELSGSELQGINVRDFDYCY